MAARCSVARCHHTIRATNRPCRTFSRTSSTNHEHPNFNDKTRPSRQSTSKTVQEQRDLFVDILQAHATRRDARQFLTRIEQREPAKAYAGTESIRKGNAQAALHSRRLRNTGVNCGPLYGPGKAIIESPKFVATTDLDDDKFPDTSSPISHVILVTIRSPQSIDDCVLDGVALTLSQLVRLDMQVMVFLDIKGAAATRSLAPAAYRLQADRLVHALKEHNQAGARHVDSALTISPKHNVKTELPGLLLDPMQRRVIPILTNLAYNSSNGRITPIDMPEAVMSLTRLLSGLDSYPTGPRPATNRLDRIVVIDPLGGVPSSRRTDRGHVFINLEHELSGIVEDLKQLADADRLAYTKNLQMLQACLSVLPPETSALIVSPSEAATAARMAGTTVDATAEDDQDGFIQAATRRTRNPLIHNLLTNRPPVSSSLPEARLTESTSTLSRPAYYGPTLVKRGMPLLMVPDPSISAWMPPPSSPRIDITAHPDINLARLQALIEDSFRRKLDLAHYLSRIKDRFAGLIIVGEYEGAAILTYERSDPASAAAAHEDESRPRIPYLDKFAVATRSQGSSGVADIVFQCMVSTCFPDGVVWRSRTDNPVNKWYFERAKGMCKLAPLQRHAELGQSEGSAGSERGKRDEWTMFWTTPGVEADSALWREYVGICSGVEPSWLS